LGSEIDHLGLSGEIDEVGAAVEDHVAEEIVLVNLTSLGAGNSDPDGDLVFHQIVQVVVWAVSGGSFDREVPCLVGPQHAAVDKENVYGVPLFPGNLGELKTPRRLFVVVLP
jgi:hypothetical protein